MARVDMSAGEMIAIAPVEFDGLAYFELGCMYAAGRTVAPDLVTAHKWFNIAAAQGLRGCGRSAIRDRGGDEQRRDRGGAA